MTRRHLIKTILIFGLILAFQDSISAARISAPTGLLGTQTESGIHLSWDPVQEASGYLVYCGVGDQKDLKVLTPDPISGNEVDFNRLTDGAVYTFAVTAVAETGVESSWSDHVRIVWGSGEKTTYSAANAPVNVAVKAPPESIPAVSRGVSTSSDTRAYRRTEISASEPVPMPDRLSAIDMHIASLEKDKRDAGWTNALGIVGLCGLLGGPGYGEETYVRWLFVVSSFVYEGYGLSSWLEATLNLSTLKAKRYDFTSSALIPYSAPPEKRRLNLGLWAGYGIMKMADFNNYIEKDLDDSVKIFESQGGTVSDKKLSKFGGGFAAGVEGTYDVTEQVAFGLRTGYLSAGLAEENITGDLYADHGAGSTERLKFSIEGKMDAYVVPIMVGGQYKFRIAPNITFREGLFGGIGLASATSTMVTSTDIVGTGLYSFETGSNSATTIIPYSGSGGASEILLGVRIDVSENIAVGLDIGYRIITCEIRATEDVPEASVKKNDLYGETLGGNGVSFDFSGINAAFSVAVAF